MNHNGSLEMAKKMVEAAAVAGADYIKFQTFKAENLVNRFAPQAEYQQRNIGSEPESTQLDMLREFELSYADFQQLKAYCDEIGIGFLSSPFDLESVDFLASLGQDFFKIPSGEITNLPYLRKIANLGKPVVMSTGMSTYDDVQAAINVLYKNGLMPTQLTLLHCTTQYPTPMQDVNLLAMNTLRERFGVAVGYSDHTPGIEVSIAAAALGAKVLEKHFTLDRTLPGPDHVASLEPHELKQLVDSVRNVVGALGSPKKMVTASETGNKSVARKSIVARCEIKKGEEFTEENLTVKRPGTGITPMLWDSLLGERATRDFLPDELITF